MTAARSTFEAAEDGVGEWLAAATAFATTDDGHAELLALLPDAALFGDVDRQDQIHAALLRGERARAEQDIAAASVSKPTAAVSDGDLQLIADDFGVALEQVRRDHVISHILAALSAPGLADEFTFYGGTALSRTLLPRLRLSEDIDLIAQRARRSTAEDIENTIEKALARTHGKVAWEPRLSATTGAKSAVLRTDYGVVIRIQMMKQIDLPSWPTHKQQLLQRYADARPAKLRVFTPSAFAAAKTLAWMDRRASRDLYDLWALALLGLIDAQAADVYRRYGNGAIPGAWMFRDASDEDAWNVALAHQGRVRVNPADALRVVCASWAGAGEQLPFRVQSSQSQKGP